MDKYVSCSRCKYKALLEYKALQKLVGVERIDFLDFVCSHCKKKILHKHDNIDTKKHVVSYNNSIKRTPSEASIPPVKQYERNDKQLNSSHSSTKKLEKLKRSESSYSKESVATYDTVKMQEELKTTGAGLKLKEGKSKEHKYSLKQIRDKYEKQITSPPTNYALSEQEQENFRFWFPDKDLDKSEPIQYTKNRTSTDIIKDMFDEEAVKYNIKIKDPPNIVESIGDGDWSSKIVKKYATENKLKCFDMKSFETFDQNKYQQIKNTDMEGKGQELDNVEESTKDQIKTITTEKPKKQKSTQKREKALKSISTKKTKVIQKLKEKKDKKQTGDGDSRDRDDKEEKKMLKYSHPKQTFDEADLDTLKKGTLSKEDVAEHYKHESVTATKISVEDVKGGQKNIGKGEGDELETARKRHIKESKDKVLKKSKEENGKVSKVDVRDPNITNKKQSLLKDIVKIFKEKETSENENLNPNEVKVSKIGLKDKRGFKKEKKQIILSDKTKIKDSDLDTLQGDQEVPKGTTRYALSDPRYIDKGWTKLPTEKTVRKMLLYKMKQSHPEFDWFNRNKHKKEMFYNTGEKLADFENEEGSKDHLKKTKGDKTKEKNKLYYRNGKVALEQYVPEEENNKKRIVVYSKGEPDESGRPRPSTVLATFDHLGNGVVYDHDGNVRLKYNQTEGVLLDKTVGPFSHWKWHTLNDPPELKDVMTETTLVPKDMNIAKLAKPNEVKKIEDEEIHTIAMENFIKSKQKKFKPYSVKTKTVKINEHFSLKVIDQATIYLNFKDHPINMKINIGMVLDEKGIVNTELAEIGDVSASVEKVPPKTASLAALQSQWKHIQRLQRKRFERDILLRLKQPSIDRLYAGVSKPRTHKVITVKVDKACQCNLLCCDQFFYTCI